MARQPGKRARLRLAVGDVRNLREFLSDPARRGRLKARQRRRFAATIRNLREAEGDTTGNAVILAQRVTRNILWCLAQVPGFPKAMQRVVDDVFGRD